MIEWTGKKLFNVLRAYGMHDKLVSMIERVKMW